MQFGEQSIGIDQLRDLEDHFELDPHLTEAVRRFAEARRKEESPQSRPPTRTEPTGRGQCVPPQSRRAAWGRSRREAG